ncbi:MAG: hypothetical protein OK457_01345 [Thaumarchaeota archaeon]|nr:hypothetical protein [Nitrososphaerota archaeon]
MGIKKRVQAATGKLTSRVLQTGVGKRLTNPNSATSLKDRGVEWLYLIALYLLVAGVINAIGNSGQAGINLNPIVANPNAQNVTETIIIMFAYIIGSLGAYALYLSGRQTIRARSAEMFFVGGIALIAIAMTVGYYILTLK